ncbi:hypothetical protein lerEdw1_018851 [Lerista edwardsae]|nr:hypothetical protein lerEdw1_018851 [Lerista edwardsae]
MSGEVRLRQLEQFILDGPTQTNGQCFSVETLLDILICLYDECNNSPLRREKNILEYLEWAAGACQLKRFKNAKHAVLLLLYTTSVVTDAGDPGGGNAGQNAEDQKKG